MTADTGPGGVRRRSRIFVASAVVTMAIAAVGPIPAFTAESGTIVGTVTAAAAPAPCIQLSTTTLDFGTLPFATNGAFSQGRADFTVMNCSTAVSGFLIAGTDATGPGATWALTDGWLDCDGRLNRYGVRWAELPESFSGSYLTTTPIILNHRRPPTNAPQSTFDPGEAETLAGLLTMPCVGSNGAGQAFSFSIALTATVA